jgi:acyl transferase domain-containing protein
VAWAAGFSSITGLPARPETSDTTFWWNAIRQPVQIQQTFEAMIAAGAGIFIEIGGRTSFAPHLREAASAAGRPIHAMPSMSLDRDLAATLDDAERAVRQAGRS